MEVSLPFYQMSSYLHRPGDCNTRSQVPLVRCIRAGSKCGTSHEGRFMELNLGEFIDVEQSQNEGHRTSPSQHLQELYDHGIPFSVICFPLFLLEMFLCSTLCTQDHPLVALRTQGRSDLGQALCKSSCIS